MNEEYVKAFSEVHEILKLIPKELLDKIPKEFINIIEKGRDKNYIPNIKKPIEKQILKRETVVILGLIYRDFLCSPEEKKRLLQKDSIEIQEAQKELKVNFNQKNNSDIIVTNKSKEQSEEKSLIVVQEEKWYKKIFNIIKKLFQRNN